MNRIKPGGASGVCDIYPQYMSYDTAETMHYVLHRIFIRVSEEEVVPEEWHQGIVIIKERDPNRSAVITET